MAKPRSSLGKGRRYFNGALPKPLLSIVSASWNLLKRSGLTP